jgi:PAS domain S-box-containing protein
MENPHQVVRTAPYPAVTTSDVNIGTVKALVDENGQPYGVVGIDITLSNLTDFLSEVTVGQETYITLLDDSGTILTGQDESALFKTYDEAGKGYLQPMMEQQEGYLSFEADGQDHYIFYLTSEELDWKIGAVVPAQEIDRQVNAFVYRFVAMMAVAFLLLSVLTIGATHRFVVRPIRKLQAKARRIVQTGELDHYVDVESKDEIGDLAVSFNEMIVDMNHTRQELLSSEEEYRSLVENINVGVFRSTIEGRLLHANPAARRILDYDSLEEILEIPVPEMYEDAQDRADILEMLEAQGSIRDYEVRMLKKDGTPIWISLSVAVRYDDEGQIASLEGVIEDIGGRKAAEEALVQAHDEMEARVTERTAALMRNAERLEILHEIDQSVLAARMPETIALAAITRIRQLVNCQRAAVVALQDTETAEEVRFLASQSDRDVARLDDPSVYRELLDEPILVQGQIYGVEDLAAQNLRSFVQQALYDVGVRSYIVVPLLGQDGLVGILNLEFTRPRAFTADDVAIAREVATSLAVAIRQAHLYAKLQQELTERIKAEEALRRRTADLEARNAELDAFAHTVAHDLKNPAGAIVGYADILTRDRERLPKDIEQRFLSTLARNARKMTVIVDELLLLASVREQQDVEIQALDMAQIVSEAQSRLQYLLDQHEGKIVAPEVWPEAVGYAPWIEEIWANYISNAIKYGGRPPQIELGAERLVVDPEDPAATAGMIRFWVRDNGPGLTPEQQVRLFTPFERLHQVRVEGHGLGLSIVQRIVQKLGGQVGVECDGHEGEGCLFYFTLPAWHIVPENKDVGSSLSEGG